MFNNITVQIEGDFMVSNDRKAKYLAFTLAEVLVTLGIIGIVATLTLPSVVNNFKRKSFEPFFVIKNTFLCIDVIQ